MNFNEQTFCITGVVPGICRNDLLEHIEARDAEWTDRMSKAVTVLVIGERVCGTTKYEKAMKYGTQTMEYEEFMRWMMHTPLADPNAHIRPLEQGSSRKYLGGAHVVAPCSNDNENDNENLFVDENDMPMRPESTLTDDICKVVSTIAAIAIVLVKGALVVAGVSLCVVFWLCGIPVAPGGK